MHAAPFPGPPAHASLAFSKGTTLGPQPTTVWLLGRIPQGSLVQNLPCKEMVPSPHSTSVSPSIQLAKSQDPLLGGVVRIKEKNLCKGQSLACSRCSVNAGCGGSRGCLQGWGVREWAGGGGGRGGSGKLGPRRLDSRQPHHVRVIVFKVLVLSCDARGHCPVQEQGADQTVSSLVASFLGGETESGPRSQDRAKHVSQDPVASILGS